MPLPQRLARELRALLRNRVAIVLLAMAFAWFLAERRRRRRAARHRKRRNRRWQEAIRGAQALAELRGFGVRNAGAFVKLSRGRTHYVLAGPEDGAPVVLCHGFAVGCWVYDRFVAPLAAQGFRVLLFDWYGCGYSDRASPDPAFKSGTRAPRYDAKLFVTQLLELLDSTEINFLLNQDGTPKRAGGKGGGKGDGKGDGQGDGQDDGGGKDGAAAGPPKVKVSLAGHSMGGQLAAEFAVRHPERVERLLLICPAGTPYRIDFFKPGALYLNLVHLGQRLVTLPVVGELFLRGAVAFTQQLTRLQLAGLDGVLPGGDGVRRNLSFSSLSTAADKMRRVNSHADLREEGARFARMIDMCGKGWAFQRENSTPREFAAALSSMLRYLDLFGDHSQLYERVDALSARTAHAAGVGFETLVMWGEKDEFIPYENCARILRPRMPRASFLSFEDADHFCFLNRPEDFLREVLSWLQWKPRVNAALFAPRGGGLGGAAAGGEGAGGKDRLPAVLEAAPRPAAPELAEGAGAGPAAAAAGAGDDGDGDGGGTGNDDDGGGDGGGGSPRRRHRGIATIPKRDPSEHCRARVAQAHADGGHASSGAASVASTRLSRNSSGGGLAGAAAARAVEIDLLRARLVELERMQRGGGGGGGGADMMHFSH